MDIQSIASKAKKASRQISFASTGKKNSVLKKMAQLLQKNKDEIINANKKDVALAKGKEFPENIINRLIFNEYKLESRVNSLKKIIALPDPVGQIRKMEKKTNGLLVGSIGFWVF